MSDKTKTVAKLIQESKHLVLFTGAGISTPSGLPDYRGPDGVWTRRDKGLQPKPMNKRWSEFKPNVAHESIVKLQELGHLKFLISQNVDNLHIKSGIRPHLIAELHGNSMIMKCLICDSRFGVEEIGWDTKSFGRGYRTQEPVAGQPVCKNCNGRIISSVVNFGDPMPNTETDLAIEHSKLSDVYLVIGTTAEVNPAASYPRIAKRNGAKLIIINKGHTAIDSYADIRIEGDCSVVLPEIMNQI